MPSLYTTNLSIEKPATGEQDGTWGNTVNENMDMLDAAIAGQVVVTLTTAGTTVAPNTLPITEGTVTDGINAYLDIWDNADLLGNVYLQLGPSDAEKICYIRNSLRSSRDLYLFQGTYDAGRDYVLAAGKTAIIRFTGQGDSASYAYNVLENLVVTSLSATGTVSGSNIIDWTTPSAALFNSTGIDDNATAERLQISDTTIEVGGATAASIYYVGKPTEDGVLVIGSLAAPSASTGAVLKLFGNTHATQSGDFELWDGANAMLKYSNYGFYFQPSTEVSMYTLYVGTVGIDNATLTDDNQFVISGKNATTPSIKWDANDFLDYDRTANQFNFIIGSTTEFSLNATTADFIGNNIVTTGYIRSADKIYAGNTTLTTDDLFYMAALDATKPQILFDTGDYITYDRTANSLNVYVGSTLELSINSGQSNFQNNQINTSGDITATNLSAGTELFAAVNVLDTGTLRLGALNSTTPYIGFGDTSDIIKFDQTNSIFSFNINGATYFTLNTAEANFKTNVITWGLGTADAPFFNFVATADNDTVSAISTKTVSGATTHHVQVDINGTKAWIAVSTNAPS